ncbi:MAG: DUF192 domain-containing protein [Candidatus Promineifilaceae bacterium]
MSTYRKIIHQESGRTLVEKAKWCNTFTTKLRGFTFRRIWQPGDGLVLVEKNDNRVGTAIHMLFVFFDLGVLWVNDAGEIVDKTVARPWRLSYVPQAPARYVIEAHPDIVAQVSVGDLIAFSER